MAEGILRHLLAERGEDSISVESAGTGAMDGFPAAPNAVEAAKNLEIDISSHRGRQLTSSMIADSDLILAMAPEHVETIKRLHDGALRKTFLVKAFPKSYSV